jgi:hypothetical protein
MTIYEAITYRPFATEHSSETIYEGVSVAEAREAVAERLGVALEALETLRFLGDGEELEIYHEYPTEHEHADCCGGITIRRRV